VERVGEVRQAGVGLPRRCIDVGGAFHFERLVWALGIEFPDEIVEAGLLLEAIGAWRADGLLLECSKRSGWRSATPCKVSTTSNNC
jgi:hypothetical protein